LESVAMVGLGAQIADLEIYESACKSGNANETRAHAQTLRNRKKPMRLHGKP